jgi:hypothetical protein
VRAGRLGTRTGLALAALLCGCGSARPPPSQFPTAADALARMKETYRCERGVKGEARIDHFSQRGRIRGKLLLFASRPAELRFDLMSPPPMSSILATLTAGDGRFSLSDLRERRFYEGPASACNIARLTEVPIVAHALVDLLGGRAPVLVHDDARLEMEWNGHGYYVVRIPSTRGSSEQIRLAPVPADFMRPWAVQRVRVLDVRVSQHGVDVYHAELGDHRTAKIGRPLVDPDGIDPPVLPSGPPCEVEVPRKIRIEVPDGDQDMLFRYDDVEVNPPLPPGVFSQPVPGGAEHLWVECS